MDSVGLKDSNDNRARRPVLKAKSLSWLCMITVAILAWSAFAQEGQDTPNQTQNPDSLLWSSPLVLVECVWLVLIGIGVPMYSWCVGKPCKNSSDLRGLNMPRGSIRGILALLVVGSFVNVLILGGPALGQHFEVVVSAFGALTGSIIGFYFGSRNATPLPSESSAPDTQVQNKD